MKEELMECGNAKACECESPRSIEKNKKSRKDLLRDYDIRINFLNTGCTIKIGCKTIPFSTITEAMKELNDYVSDPEKSYNKWYKIFESEE